MLSITCSIFIAFFIIYKENITIIWVKHNALVNMYSMWFHCYFSTGNQFSSYSIIKNKLYIRIFCHSIHYAHTNIHTCTQIHTHTNTYTHKHIHTQTHTHTNTYTHKHIHTQTHTHTNTYSHKHIHTQTHTNTYTHKHIHTQTHTHTNTYTQSLICTYVAGDIQDWWVHQVQNCLSVVVKGWVND